MNLSKKVVKTKHFFAKILQGKNPLIVRQEKSKWDAQFKAGKWDFMLETQPNREVIANLCAKYSKNIPIEILDVGCGNGGLVAALETQNGNFIYTGIDFSTEALEKVKSNFPTKKFIYADIEHPPVFPQKFDIIIFSEILYYVKAKQVIATYAKLLKKDGIFIISMYRSWRTRLVWFMLGGILNEQEHHGSTLTKKGTEVHWDIKVMESRK